MSDPKNEDKTDDKGEDRYTVPALARGLQLSFSQLLWLHPTHPMLGTDLTPSRSQHAGHHPHGKVRQLFQAHGYLRKPIGGK